MSPRENSLFSRVFTLKFVLQVYADKIYTSNEFKKVKEGFSVIKATEQRTISHVYFSTERGQEHGERRSDRVAEEHEGEIQNTTGRMSPSQLAL